MFPDIFVELLPSPVFATFRAFIELSQIFELLSSFPKFSSFQAWRGASSIHNYPEYSFIHHWIYHPHLFLPNLGEPRITHTEQKRSLMKLMCTLYGRTRANARYPIYRYSQITIPRLVEHIHTLTGQAVDSSVGKVAWWRKKSRSFLDFICFYLYVGYLERMSFYWLTELKSDFVRIKNIDEIAVRKCVTIKSILHTNQKEL